MRLPKRTLFPLFAVLCGVAAVVAGVYLLWGLPWSLIVGGGVLVTFGLLVDVP